MTLNLMTSILMTLISMTSMTFMSMTVIFCAKTSYFIIWTTKLKYLKGLYFIDWKKGSLCFLLSLGRRRPSRSREILRLINFCCPTTTVVVLLFWSFSSQFSRWRGKSLLCPNKVKTKGYNTHPSLCAHSCILKSSFKQKIQPRRKGSI